MEISTGVVDELYSSRRLVISWILLSAKHDTNNIERRYITLYIFRVH